MAVFGDFALDAYWVLGEGPTDVSVETGLAVREVERHWYGPGGAANVAANVAALGAREVVAVGMVGDDPFGRELRSELAGRGVDVAALRPRAEQPDWMTQTFAKPRCGGRELARFDFGNRNVLAEAAMGALLEDLEGAADRCDVVILNQQVPAGVSPPAMIERLNELVARRPDRLFVADSRHRPRAYRGVVLKINDLEVMRCSGAPARRPVPLEVLADHARELAAALDRPMLVTRGEWGILVVDGGEVAVVPGVPTSGPVDPVGAGDTVVAAAAAAFAVGADPLQAALLANAAAAVTVTKLETTGTACPEEILALCAAAQR